MSGGHFDYEDRRIRYIAEDIERIIALNRVERPKESLASYDYDENGNVEEWAKYHYNYPDEVIEKFKEAVIRLREAYVYAHCIDYLICGDYGEESFFEVLEEKLAELKDYKFPTKEVYLE